MIPQSDLLYTAEQVRRLDRCAIEEHAIAGIDLMERAGRCVFDLALSVSGQASDRDPPWVVCCGAGNNGGDGYIVARLARERGIPVTLLALKQPAELAGDAARAARRWHEAGGETQAWTAPPTGAAALVIDALLGTGLDREPAGAYAEAIDWMNHQPAPVVAIDIPSGLQADTGRVLGRAVQAAVTATFIGNKRGLFTMDGPDQAGQVVFSALGTPDVVRDSEPGHGLLLRAGLLGKLLPPRRRNSHKGSYGWVIGIGGNRGMSGAIRLCGEAALRSGAGKVTLATRAEHAALVNAGCPELMVRPAESAAEVREGLQSGDVIVAGTGLGRTAWSNRVMDACLELEQPLVLDADALNILADRALSIGVAAARQDGQPPILTPHPAEAARLLGSTPASVQADRVACALELAEAQRAVVILKGCGSVIAGPDGRYAICALGNPGMATAGSGDVLSGVVAALLAQGLDSWRAACAAVVAHAAAGDLAAARIGERGLMASDITRCLPRVLNPSNRTDPA